MLMVGPPGSGKTMLARRFPTILPDLSLDEALETTKIHSVAGLLDPQTPLLATRPFRSPHHTISDAGLIGGGSYPRPGEVSLSHHGVLFLDELPEFNKNVLENLRTASAVWILVGSFLLTRDVLETMRTASAVKRCFEEYQYLPFEAEYARAA